MLSTILAADSYIAGTDELSLGLLVLRVGVGLTLAAHGYAKYFKGGRIAGTAGWFDSMGMRPGRFHAILAASTEIGAGLLFAAGLVTPLAALRLRWPHVCGVLHQPSFQRVLHCRQRLRVQLRAGNHRHRGDNHGTWQVLA